MANNSKQSRVKRNREMVFFLFAFFFGFRVAAQELIVDAGKPGAVIPSTMWGIFFEDINLAADGGLYAELIKNRSFEFNNPLMGWKEQKKGKTGGRLLVLN